MLDIPMHAVGSHSVSASGRQHSSLKGSPYVKLSSGSALATIVTTSTTLQAVPNMEVAMNQPWHHSRLTAASP
jgi:hypothetical protein